MIYIIHGTYGSPDGNWFPWLKTEAEKLGQQVIVPKFPTPDNQSLESWTKVMSKYKIDKDTILVGHSLGAAFILSLLEKHKAKAAFLVAGFITPLDSDFDIYNITFYKQFDWEKIRKNCNFYIFNSDDDPYVRLEKAAELSENLRTELNIIKSGGHINKESGYTEFPMLLEKIRMVI